jgi:GTP pyrophosphokinase
MHQRAEFGVAAHWLYKQNIRTGQQASGRSSTSEMAWLERINDWQQETSDSDEFLDSLRFEIGAKEVYVFTPQGKVIGLPQSATPVDFAYSIHTDVGHRTMGAKVNGRLVPLETKLQNGDTVEIFTSKNPDAGPKQDWLAFVASPRARNKIRQWFSKERRDEAIELGKDQVAKEMRKVNMPMSRDIVQEAFATVASTLRYVDVSGLYAAVGEGHVSAKSVIEKIQHELTSDQDVDAELGDRQITGSPIDQPVTSDSGVLVRGAPDILVKVAKCCTPVPGDEIVGFITRGQGVSVHRSDCRNVTELKQQPERMIDVEWAESSKAVFLVNIQVEALDRGGLLSDISRVLSEHHVNILSATVHTSRERVAISKFSFQMGDTTHLDRLLGAVRQIDGIYDVYRVHNG